MRLFILKVFNTVLLLHVFVISKSQINQVINISDSLVINSVKLADSNYYSQISLKNFDNNYIVAHPNLPCQSYTFIVPSNAINFSVSTVTSNSQIYSLISHPCPSQEDKTSNNLPYQFSNPDSSIYSSNNIYPQNIAVITGVGSLRGDQLVTVTVYSCVYNPYLMELTQYHTINLTLNYTINSNLPDVKIKEVYKIQQELMLQTFVKNNNDINQYSVAYKPSNTSTSSLGKLGVSVNSEYVIVTSSNLISAFNEFIAWKRRKGIKVEIVSIDNIYLNYSGDLISGINDNAGKLRQFLADAYNNGNGIKYALLAGSNNIIPIRYGRVELDPNIDPQEYMNIPTDIYFADFNGDWDVDGDDKYGEASPDDRPDFYLEIGIGRVPFKSPEEVKNWTRKLIQYEMNPGNGDYAYLTKAFFTEADFMQQLLFSKTILDRYTWIPTASRNVFQEQGGPYTLSVPVFPKGKDIIDEYNKNYGLVTFGAHGGDCNVAVATKGDNGDGDQSPVKYKVTSFDNGSAGCCAINEYGNSFENMKIQIIRI